MRKRLIQRPSRFRYLASVIQLLLLSSYGWLPGAAEAGRLPKSSPQYRLATTRLPGGETVVHPVGWAVQGAGDELLLLGYDTGEAIIVGRRSQRPLGAADAIARALLDEVRASGLSPLVTDTFRIGPHQFVEAFVRGRDGFESTILVLVSDADRGPALLASADGAVPRTEAYSFLYATYSGPPEQYDLLRVSRLLMRVVSSLSPLRERAPTPTR